MCLVKIGDEKYFDDKNVFWLGVNFNFFGLKIVFIFPMDEIGYHYFH
jgi:hypothetical protein